MAGRRFLLAVVLLAAVLHGISIARSLLPAQDGLKFIRIAREFQTDPWPDVVRGTDQHPLYPALIAAVEPLFERLAGTGPDAWRIAAQWVAALASLLLLLPLFGITRACLTSVLPVLRSRSTPFCLCRQRWATIP